MKKTLFLLILLGSCCWLQAQSPINLTAEEREKAKAAWEALIKTKGGRESLYSVKNMQISSKLSLSGKIIISELYVLPDKVWKFTYFLDGTPVVLTIDGTSQTSRSANRKGVFGRQTNFALPNWWIRRRLIYLLETETEKPDPVRVLRTAVGKETLDSIETIFQGRRLDFYYEPEKMLVARAVFYSAAGKPSETYEFGNYMKINGIYMPQQERLSFDNERSRDLWHMEFQFNVDYDPKIFTEDLRATTADGWKRRPVP